MQAKKLNLKSDGHGSWMDTRGNIVATTDKGKLVFIDKKKAKAQDDKPQQARGAATPEAKPKKSAPQVDQKKKAATSDEADYFIGTIRSSDSCIWTFQSTNSWS